MTDVAGNLTTTLNTSLLEVTLEHLEPYSVYTVSVCAFTIKCSANINLTAKTLGGIYVYVVLYVSEIMVVLAVYIGIAARSSYIFNIYI